MSTQNGTRHPTSSVSTTSDLSTTTNSVYPRGNNSDSKQEPNQERSLHHRYYLPSKVPHPIWSHTFFEKFSYRLVLPDQLVYDMDVNTVDPKVLPDELRSVFSCSP